ncbi:uncharacterized protein LOC141631152 [Silene latifolia]|uniref:uncharacterized protein LOC141631152 n=1 Tax=Silene latifolia TaxID=37657 RepID=UPI003D76ACF7
MAGDDTNTTVSFPRIDPSSPYYLGSQDGPGAKISNIELRHDNYDAWQMSMKMSLKSRRKFGFVDGTIKKPTTQFDLENWEAVHCTIVQWIRNTISPSLLDNVTYGYDASILWAELESQFAVVDGTKIHNLKTQLKDLKQTKGMSVTTYYGKLKSIWDSLAVHEPPFSCKCNKCECDIGKAAIQRLDNEKLHQFFMGLDTTLYGNIRSQQFQLDPLPTLNGAYNIVLQEERLRSESIPDVSDVSAFALSPANFNTHSKDRAPRRPLFCSHCETRGHEVATCFFKTNRFPEWWGDRPRTLAEYRHYRLTIAGGSRGSGSGAAGSGAAGSGAAGSGASGSGSGRDKDGTIPVRANAVMGPTAHSLLASDRLSGMCSWILDTGASNHVTGTLSCLETRKEINGRPVCLPNGQQVVAAMTGTVYINEFITLRDDRSLRTTIGAGELRDGLYWIRAGTRTAVVNNMTQQGTFDLWHRRLGHPSDKIVKLIPPLSSFNCDKTINKDLYTKGDKFTKRGRKCVFVGYPSNKKGWKLYDLETKSFFVSRDVIFHETEFPFNSHGATEISSPMADSISYDEPFDGSLYSDPGPDGAGNSTHDGSGEATVETPATDTSNSPTGAATDPSSSETGAAVPHETEDTVLGRGHRIRFPNSRLQGYILDTTHSPSPSPSPPSSPTSSSGTSYHLANYLNCNLFSEKHRNFLAAVTMGVEPPSFKEAIRDDGWCEAMKLEIDALERNDTWELSDLPPNKKALGCRWIYKIKYKSDGSIERLKARLVVFGNHQIEGLDYGETFAPVVKMVTVRIFLAIAAINKWELHQMDVHNAFLHGDLDEEVYMKIPPGFSRGKEGKVRLFILIYVDDLVIAGNDSSAVANFKSYLGKCFHMKDLGPLKYFLGLEISRSSEGIYVNQRKYALEIISEVGLLGCKPAQTPMEQHHTLGNATGPLLENIESYRRLVGRLVYLSVTRPDLSYAVHILSRFLHQPREDHMSAALRVVKYLKGSPGQGILLRADSNLNLTGWCDSDYGGCPTSRRSVSGWFIFLGDSPVSWKTKKQTTVSLSSAEAEYRSMANIVCELKWMKGLLLNFGININSPMKVFSDSKSALDLARNPVFHERTKHIEIDCHFIRDAIIEGLITAAHVSTTSQLADIFTKALGASQFHTLLRKLGVLDLHAPA